MSEPKVLIVDIETSPSRVWTWGLFNQNIGINQVDKPGQMICWAAKWVGQKKMHYRSEYTAGGRLEMVEEIWRLMDDADYIVHYNGTSFDVKHIHREMLLLGMGPPAPHKNIDLLKVVKQRFKFLSNKLQHVSEQLEIGQKLVHTGFDLWRGWMEEDPSSIKLMGRYCRQDVNLTEDLFDELSDWIPPMQLRNAQLIDGAKPDVCPRPGCGSVDLHKDGFYYAPTSKYQRWRCENGHISRESARVAGATLREVT